MGVFPALQTLFRPEVVTDVPRFFPWICGLIWIGYVLLFVRPTGQISWLDFVASFLVAICIASNQGAERVSESVWFGLGGLAFVCLFLVLVLIRRWRGDLHSVAVGLLTLFIGLQLLAACCGVTSYQEPFLPDHFVLSCFLGWDIILIMSLVVLKAVRIVCAATLFFLVLFVVIPIVVPLAGHPGRIRFEPLLMADVSTLATPKVSVLQHKVVGIYDTTVIASSEATALQHWLADNGYFVPANSGPVIADYVKNGWVFVAANVRRDEAFQDTLTPQPLSFTFETDKPVYPMRLTGLANKRLSVDLYVFSTMRADAPHFKVEGCAQLDMFRSLLAGWTAGLPVITKLSGTLTANDMRQDVWLGQSSYEPKRPDRMFSRQAAWTLALNRGTEVFGIGLAVVCLFGFVAAPIRNKIPALVAVLVIVVAAIIGGTYFSLPRTDVTWVRRWALGDEQLPLVYGLLRQ